MSLPAAEAYLNSVAEKVKAVNPEDSTTAVEKVSVEAKNSSVDGYVPGFGYSNANFAKAVKNAKVGEWTSAMATENGAVMLKVESKKAPEDEALKAAVKNEVANASGYAGASLFNDYLANLEAATPVVNNMDLFYRD